MPKTVIEKCQSPSPEITVFRVSGTLGFHEKETLVKLFSECKKRELTNVILDVEGLTSLGGGCANIIRDEAASGQINIGIARAKATVIKFLKDENSRIVMADSIDDAAARLLGAEAQSGAGPSAQTVEAPEPVEPAEVEAAGVTQHLKPATKPDAQEAPTVESTVASPGKTAGPPDTPDATAACAPVSDGENEKETVKTRVEEVRRENRETEKPATTAARQEAGPATKKKTETPAAPAKADPSPQDLRKRIFQYNTVLSLASDLYRINDRKNLLELFLLTTIAQIGVESAVFLEYHDGYFTPEAVKGIEAHELRGLAISAERLDLEEWKRTREVLPVNSRFLSDDMRAPLLSIGCSYVAPFITRGDFRGLVAMGKPVRSELDEGTTEFLKILINQAAIAYESTQRFEEEKKRTLGVVQTLISLIEQNTLARGNTNLISNYTHELALKLHYPEEYLRDLIYGTVLRDIGMIKVSDLIVRSPRELMPEEWEIIKRHPIDGGEMLRKMKFSEHAVAIVAAHHERFNGEGYPYGIQGKQIPLGARIVSIVESYAAMLQDRPTRPALTNEEALNTLKENWGNRYDPEVVAAFVEVVEEELRAGEKSFNAHFELSSI